MGLQDVQIEPRTWVELSSSGDPQLHVRFPTPIARRGQTEQTILRAFLAASEQAAERDATERDAAERDDKAASGAAVVDASGSDASGSDASPTNPATADKMAAVDAASKNTGGPRASNGNGAIGMRRRAKRPAC